MNLIPIKAEDRWERAVQEKNELSEKVECITEAAEVRIGELLPMEPTAEVIVIASAEEQARIILLQRDQLWRQVDKIFLNCRGPIESEESELSSAELEYYRGELDTYIVNGLSFNTG